MAMRSTESPLGVLLVSSPSISCSWVHVACVVWHQSIRQLRLGGEKRGSSTTYSQHYGAVCDSSRHLRWFHLGLSSLSIASHASPLHSAASRPISRAQPLDRAEAAG
ncbi:hypothetical protein M440DRAFT_1253020 [Trichoderma longibrachiatum ATCC 18648]|uniref:Uncharacterized protein n=1 Tax=Trichoderma longibrachiatum ATCC 18648 TaxID=983965 RepID=A0A2T4C4J1_TRILO|nr:hypothetical protein M440DRAFT_1253020 [Trichoderma longibrachiatum ATCC 18648]